MKNINTTCRAKLHGQSQNWRDLNFFFLSFFLSSTLNNMGNYSSPNVMFIAMIVRKNSCVLDLPRCGSNSIRSSAVQNIWKSPQRAKDYVTLNSQMHSNSLCTFVSYREAPRERKKETESEKLTSSFIIRMTLFALDWPKSLFA